MQGAEIIRNRVKLISCIWIIKINYIYGRVLCMYVICNNIQNTTSPNNPYWRCAKWSGGKFLSWIFLTNLRAVSGGSPVPVVEITITTGSFSPSKLYYNEQNKQVIRHHLIRICGLAYYFPLFLFPKVQRKAFNLILPVLNHRNAFMYLQVLLRMQTVILFVTLFINLRYRTTWTEEKW